MILMYDETAARIGEREDFPLEFGVNLAPFHSPASGIKSFSTFFTRQIIIPYTC